MTSAQKLTKWVNEQVNKIGGPVPIEAIFRQAVEIDSKVKLLPYIQYGALFYVVAFNDGDENVFGGEQQP